MGTRPIPRPASRPTAGVERWNQIRTQLHGKLVSALTPEQLKNLSKEGVRDQIATVTDRFVHESGLPMTTAEKDRLIEEVLDDRPWYIRWPVAIGTAWLLGYAKEQLYDTHPDSRDSNEWALGAALTCTVRLRF
jgi:hypothetical protein